MRATVNSAVDVPILDTSCFYTVNGQPIRNAAGQIVTFQATDVIRWARQTSAVPDDSS
jgi:hypothetical protein